MSSDKTLTCRDCGTSFVFTSGEQDFYAAKGFTNEPTRCPTCRAANKARRNGGSAGYASSGSSDYTRTERQMYPAICATCGKETQVPFEPRLDKPVYCSDCFVPRQRSYGGSSDYGSGSGSGGYSSRGGGGGGGRRRSSWS